MRPRLVILFNFILSSLLLEAGELPSFTRLESGDMVFSLFQDERGMVWAGTQYGLANFNGNAFSHKKFYLQGQAAPRDMRVNCSLAAGGQNFLVGTSCGLFRLDLKSMQADRISCLESQDVRCVCRIGEGEYLVCSSTGLYRYENGDASLEKTAISAMCYQAVSIDSTRVLVCSYLGAYIFDSTGKSISKVPGVPVCSDGILSAALDEGRDCVWLGTNGALYRYDISSGACSAVSLPSNTFKSLLLDSTGLLLCGTENGLLIYDAASGNVRTERYKSKDYSTLTGNVIWSLMEDEDGNIWVGTNKGVSVWQRNSPVTILDWDVLTGSDQENNLLCVARDIDGMLWTGGDAGATVFYAPDAGQFHSWYRTDDPQHRLNKNTVRRITIDDDGDLWLATDEGINLLDRSKGKFRNYIVCNESGAMSAHWVYDVLDDHKGNLWIATYESGVFIVDKKAIKSSPGGQFHTGRTISSENGMIGNNTVGRLAPGEGDSMWMLLTNQGLLSYDAATESCRLFPPEYFSSPDPLRNPFVQGDQVWVGTLGGLYCLDAKSLQYRYLPMPRMAYSNPFAFSDGKLWVIDGESLVEVDPVSLETTEIMLGYSGFVDGMLWGDDKIVLGGKGRLAVVSTTTQDDIPQEPRVYITDFRFNGVSEEMAGNPDYVKEIVVPFGKDLEIDVSTGFFQRGVNDIEYSLSGKYSWTRMNKVSQSINFAGLRPGRHSLQFRSVDNGAILKELDIRIMAAWYMRWYMFLVYAVLISLSVVLVRALARTRAYLNKKQAQLDNIRLMTAADSTVKSSDKKFIERLNQYIEENLTREALSVTEIATHLRMPPKQLYRRVKSISGFPVVKYVRNFRLQKAASLLKTGGMSISEVMYHVGFSNLSYFTKCFKELYGMGPKSYLEK